MFYLVSLHVTHEGDTHSCSISRRLAGVRDRPSDIGRGSRDGLTCIRGGGSDRLSRICNAPNDVHPPRTALTLAWVDLLALGALFR